MRETSGRARTPAPIRPARRCRSTVRRSCRRRRGGVPGGSRAPIRRGPTERNVRPPGGSARASVATTPIVVFKGGDAGCSRRRDGDRPAPAVGVRRSPKVGVRHPRQSGIRVDHGSDGVHDRERCHGHPPAGRVSRSPRPCRLRPACHRSGHRRRHRRRRGESDAQRAADAALAPNPASGRLAKRPPRPRSKMTAVGTTGTTCAGSGPTRMPSARRSRCAITPSAAASP